MRVIRPLRCWGGGDSVGLVLCTLSPNRKEPFTNCCYNLENTLLSRKPVNSVELTFPFPGTKGLLPGQCFQALEKLVTLHLYHYKIKAHVISKVNKLSCLLKALGSDWSARGRTLDAVSLQVLVLWANHAIK